MSDKSIRSIIGKQVTINATPASGVIGWAVEEYIPVGIEVDPASYDGVNLVNWNEANRALQFGPYISDTTPRVFTYDVLGDTAGTYTITGAISEDGVGTNTTGDSEIIISEEEPQEPINFGQLVRLLANPNIPNEWTINPAKTKINSANTYSLLKIGDLVYFKNTLGVEAIRTIIGLTFGSTEIELDEPLPEGFESNDFEVHTDIPEAVKFLKEINMAGNKIVNLKSGETAQDAINVSQMNSTILGIINDLSSAISYKGNFNASTGTYDALEDSKQGDYYVVSAGGTIGSIEYNIGDHIVVNKDVEGIPVLADIDLIKNTEFPDTVYLDAMQILINKTIDADNNTILNITLDELKAGVLNTDLTELEALDTELASAKAVQDLVASEVTELKTKISNLTFIYNVIGDNTTSDFVVEHNLGSTAPIVRVINSTTKAMVFAEVELTDLNNVTVKFNPTPATGEDYTVIVLGTNF